MNMFYLHWVWLLCASDSLMMYGITKICFDWLTAVIDLQHYLFVETWYRVASTQYHVPRPGFKFHFSK